MYIHGPALNSSVLVCMYLHVCVCMHVCMYGHACTVLKLHSSMYVCMYVCMGACLYASMSIKAYLCV